VQHHLSRHTLNASCSITSADTQPPRCLAAEPPERRGPRAERETASSGVMCVSGIISVLPCPPPPIPLSDTHVPYHFHVLYIKPHVLSTLVLVFYLPPIRQTQKCLSIPPSTYCVMRAHLLRPKLSSAGHRRDTNAEAGKARSRPRLCRGKAGKRSL